MTYNNRFSDLIESITVLHANNVDQGAHHYAFLIPNKGNITSHRKCFLCFE